MSACLSKAGRPPLLGASKKKMVDKMLFFYAPKLLGGDGRRMIDSLGVRHAWSKQSVMLQKSDKFRNQAPTCWFQDILRRAGWPIALSWKIRLHHVYRI